MTAESQLSNIVIENPLQIWLKIKLFHKYRPRVTILAMNNLPPTLRAHKNSAIS